MVMRVSTVAFEGIEARAVDVQVQISPGAVAFMIVGLPDKAVAESRERVRSALIASGLALPAKRITVNLAPADLPKEGSRLSHARVWANSKALESQGYWSNCLAHTSGPHLCDPHGTLLLPHRYF
jgi:hypothetical protein